MEKTLDGFHIQNVMSMGFSRQFEVQHSLPEKSFMLKDVSKEESFFMWRRLTAGAKRCD